MTTTSGSPSQAQAYRLLSQANRHPQTIQVDGCTYTLCVANITYQVNKHEATNSTHGSLIDRGVNGGLSGGDVRIISSSTMQFTAIEGIADSHVTDVPLSTVATVLHTTDGPIIGIFHQYAHYGKDHTLHLPLQLNRRELCLQ